MSETCGGCVYDGRPLDGVEVRIDDGEVQLRGPVLFDGYEGDPERTAAVMKDGWFRTNDLGRLDDDGRLWVTGRADDVIISGGVKVPARTVAEMIAAGARRGACGGGDRRTRPGVGRARGRLRGARRRAQLDWTCATWSKPREWAPRQLVLVEEIPLLPNGKPDRVRMRAMA